MFSCKSLTCSPRISIEEAIRSGKAHGATREDIFGCLYYHVTDQLRGFVDRLIDLKISIKLFNEDTVKLAETISKNDLLSLDLPSNVRFDRIEVSNIMDLEYVGIPGVIDAWGGLLKRTRDATLVGYFMNWAHHQPGGQPGLGGDTRKLTDKLVKAGRVSVSHWLWSTFTHSILHQLSLPSFGSSAPSNLVELMGKVSTYSQQSCLAQP